MDAFNEDWETAKSLILGALVDLNYESTVRLVNFIANCHERKITSMPINEIPTALVQGGINSVDQDGFFNSLADACRSLSYPICTLQSSEAATLKLALQNIMEKFMAQEHLLDIDEVVEPLTEALNLNYAPSKLPEYDIERLVSWTKSHGLQFSTLKLVLIIPDLESFEPLILQKLIALFSQRKSKIPLVLVIGSASFDSLTQSLPGKSLSHLTVQKFSLKQAKQSVSLITRDVLMNTDGMMLGTDLFSDLIGSFQNQNLSVDRFYKSLQVL